MRLRLLISLLFAAALPAFAADNSPRHIDFTQQLKGVDGSLLQNGDTKPPTPLTLGDVAVMALESQAQGENLSGLEKFKLDTLARKIYKQTDVVLSVEDIQTIKERIGKIEPAIVIGASWRMLDPAQE